VNQWLDFEYGGRNLYQAANFNTNATFRNNWNYYGSITRQWERISMSELRGGPAIRLPGDVAADGEINSDWRARFAGGFGGSFSRTDDDAGRSSSAWTWLAWRPTDACRTEINPSFRHNRPEFQFVDRVDRNGEDAYVYGALDQKTFDLSLRVDYSVTPDLTVQYYGAPFISAGSYRNFKRVTDPRAATYGDRFESLGATVQHDAAEGEYAVDEDGDGTAEYAFGDPDFNVRDFRSNLVVRWQYSPGSSLFVVWSQSRFGFSPSGRFDLNDDVDALFDVHPHDVFLVKINRWFTL